MLTWSIWTSCPQLPPASFSRARLAGPIRFCLAVLPRTLAGYSDCRMLRHAYVATAHCRSDSALSLLRQLQWLSVQQRITYKIAELTYKALNADISPPYADTCDRDLRSYYVMFVITCPLGVSWWSPYLLYLIVVFKSVVYYFSIFVTEIAHEHTIC